MPVAPSSPAVGVFLEAGFPSPEVEPQEEGALRAALADLPVAVLGADRLAAWLDAAAPSSVLVMTHGSAFPRDAWPAIVRFLERGGNWVNVGGVPFATPVARGTAGWAPLPPSTTFHKSLGFTHTFEVSADRAASWHPADPAAASSPLLGQFRAVSVFPLDVRLANTRDFQDEEGSPGEREGRLLPLVVGVDGGGIRVAAPFVRLDRVSGRFAGGAWLLAPLRGSVTPRAVRALVDQAAMGAVEFVARPTLAGFRPEETPSIHVQFRRPAGAPLTGAGRCRVEILRASGEPVVTGHVALAGDDGWRAGRFDVVPGQPLARGLYKVRATLDVATGEAAPPLRLRSTTGFWVYDEAMLAGGTPLAVRGDLFTRGGRPFPVVGSTYMASDVHRKFLLEPNPYLWDRDFAMMQAAGVNLVRTGLWSGWRVYMPEAGTPNEAFLRSLDVFLLTARKHDLPVIFTLFAFLPESWGGENPYLAPRSVSAQAAFAGLLARRYARTSDLAWDLINEPSFCSPGQLWRTRPNYDAWEARAWQEWTHRRHEGQPGEAWGAALGEALGLPPLEWFADRHLFGESRPRAVLDYRLFAQDAFTGWARTLRRVLASNGNASQLVTVGQDEGGLVERPSPLFFGREVDFTSMHTWWNNDALAWDSVLARLPDRPLLVEETGLMRYERPDGTAWRSETENARLLERKVAVAFGAGSAGVVQWIWNTNPYMASDNEAGIGFFRADGTARPELRPFAEMARFVGAHAPLFEGRRAEDVALLVPQSHVLSVRDFGTEATRRAVRAMYYHLQVPVRAVGEYQLAETLGAPRVILAPSPMVLSDAAWTRLLGAVELGATLLVTGPLDRDEYGRRAADRLKAFGIDAAATGVAATEFVEMAGQGLEAGFRGDKLERIEKAVVGEDRRDVITLQHGRGTILWCPVPLELAESVAPTVAFYRAGLAAAGVAPPVLVSPADPAVFVGASRFARAILVALASEGSRDRPLEVRVAGAPGATTVTLPAQRALLLLLDAKTGTEIARTTPPW